MKADKIEILLIEDSSSDARLMQRMMTEDKSVLFDCKWVQSFKEASQQLTLINPDLVLLDLYLPDADSEKVFTDLHTLIPQVPIVIVTGLVDKNRRLKMLSEGVEDYLVKGEFDGLLLRRVISHTITRRKIWLELEQSKRNLEASQKRLRTIIELSTDIVIILDKEKRIIFVNPAGEKLLNQDRGNLIGKEFSYPIDQNRKTEILFKTSKNKEVIAAMRVVPISWQDQGAYMINLHDITEHKLVEHTLSKSAKQWTATFDALSDIICLVDKKGEILHCNKAMSAYLDRPYSQIKGEKFIELFYSRFNLEDNPLMEAVRKGSREIQEIKIDNKWFKIVVEPIFDQDNKVTEFVHVAVDITESKTVEEQTQEHMYELEVFYKSSFGREERILQLKKKVEELENKLKNRQ